MHPVAIGQYYKLYLLARFIILYIYVTGFITIIPLVQLSVFVKNQCKKVCHSFRKTNANFVLLLISLTLFLSSETDAIG